jgi:glycopeptide antibiotics resistance protein
VWNTEYPLVFGSEANGYTPWSGVISSFSIWNGAVPPPAIGLPDSLLAYGSPVLLLNFCKTNLAMVRSEGKDTVTAVYLNKYFVPYRRAYLSENPADFFKDRIYFRDVIANIFLFIPFGFFFGILAKQKGRNRTHIAFTATALGFLLSLSVELLQAFLPGRFSAFSDVLSNCGGAFLGALISLLFQWIKNKHNENAVSQL